MTSAAACAASARAFRGRRPWRCRGTGVGTRCHLHRCAPLEVRTGAWADRTGCEEATLGLPNQPSAPRPLSLLHFRTLFEFVPSGRRGPRASGAGEGARRQTLSEQQQRGSALRPAAHVHLASGPWAGSLLGSKGRRNPPSALKELDFFGLKEPQKDKPPLGSQGSTPHVQALWSRGGRRRSPCCPRVWTPSPRPQRT